MSSAARAGRVAVVGMAARFPGAADTAAFWQVLLAGRPADASAPPVWDHQLFDADFFGVPEEQAELMDPQHRLFLECSWEAVEAAGYDPTALPDVTGLFAGCSFPAYLVRHLVHRPDLVERHGWHALAVANGCDALTARVAHRLNLRGPCSTVQAFSATSLVAVHLAARSLLTGEADLAVAGASSVRLPGVDDRSGATSRSGRCRPLDSAADGTLSLSGVAAVVLKRLEDAVRDGDHIHAVIAGSALTNDGAGRVDFTAPGVTAKAEAVAEALGAAGLGPDDLDYLELHAMGTPLGDAVEIAALRTVLDGRRPGSGPCPVGAVAGNVGHLDAASGMAGLLKTVLMLEHRTIPPQPGYSTPSPALRAAPGLFEVALVARPWERPEGAADLPLRAGVSSFGLGGANVHLVLEEPPRPRAAPDPRQGPHGPHLLVLSARSPAALDAACTRLRDHLLTHPELQLTDVAHTLRTGRTAFAHRRAVLCGSRAEALRLLAAPAPQAPDLEAQGPEAQGPEAQDLEPPVARWLAGGTVDWRELFPGEARRVPLPTYPFERRRYWAETTVPSRPIGAPDMMTRSDA